MRYKIKFLPLYTVLELRADGRVYKIGNSTTPAIKIDKKFYKVGDDIEADKESIKSLKRLKIIN